MNGAQGGNLQNVLSISTAANNRYLLHFNSLSSLTQWTAGIRLAMFEHATLQEAYTGSLLAGKGRYLNNIKQIMERTRFAHEDWARVRFGAGTPWRRCWSVISPPDEKEYNRAQKTMKKTSAYERVKVPKGSIKFYDTRKVTKKTRPIATISDAYAAYAIYPQSKPLIEQSTLVKIEGLVTIHNSQESTTEGFVFVMPEVHAAVTGFEIMLRWLFPVYDTFGLYGRPARLVADTLDQRGLMFAMPKDRRYGYLDILDVSGLIHSEGSQAWSERQWRRELKKLTSDRMNNQMNADPLSSRHSSQRRNTSSRVSLPHSRGAVRFGDDEYTHSQPGSRSASPVPIAGAENRLPRTDSAPPAVMFPSPHKRSASEALGYRKHQTETPSRLSHESSRLADENLPPPPPPPKHGGALGAALGKPSLSRSQTPTSLERIQSGSEVPTMQSFNEVQIPAASPLLSPPEPVGAPPAFTHQPNSRPANTPYQAPELRRAHSNVDAATLYQMQDARRRDLTPDGRTRDEDWNGEVPYRQQNTVASQSYTSRNLGVPADRSQDVVDRNQRDPRQRLSTIPGSPYVGDDAGWFQSPEQTTLPQMDGVAEEPPPYSNESAQAPERQPPPVPLHSVQSIARKPVPRPLPPMPPRDDAPPMRRSLSGPASPTSFTNDESWAGGIIDEEALERVLNRSDRQNTMRSTTTESTEPDYASTTSAPSMKKSIERARPGRLKTVGDPDLPTADSRSGGVGRLDTWEQDQVAGSREIPGVDFGPTYAYKPNPSSRPGTSGTLTQADMADKRRSKSADAMNRLSGAFGASPRASPSEGHRLSYFGGRTTPTPDYGIASGEQGGVAWQPAASPSGSNRNRNSVTPEQWVQDRAAMAAQPQQAPPRKGWPNLAHGRSSSMQGMRKLTKTPPLGRTLSGDWTQQAMQRTPPDRPQSRGAGINLNVTDAILSAREQMHVSRVTGTPLINVASNPDKQQQEYQPGLVGAVAARERDKAAFKQNRNSMAVQQAIVERQQQQMRTEADAQAQQQYQMRAQAAQHAQAQQMQAQQAQAQQMQQQMNYNKMMLAQNAMQMPMQYGGQRPGLQTSNSWQYGQQAPQGYNVASAEAYSAAGAHGAPFGQGQQQQPPPQQAYGARYLAQQQQQQQRGGQGQQWGRR